MGDAWLRILFWGQREIFLLTTPTILVPLIEEYSMAVLTKLVKTGNKEQYYYSVIVLLAYNSDYYLT